jgi:peptide deformylase
MTIRKVLIFPDARLRTKAKPVDGVTDGIKLLVNDMLETMYEHNGVGLAATQIDEHVRVITIDVSETRDQPLVLINPELIEEHNKKEESEGCLSFPGVYAKVTRAGKVKVKALDREGKSFEMEAEELLAVCIQHEMDHLVGKLFVDYLSALKRSRVLKKMEKLHKLNM